MYKIEVKEHEPSGMSIYCELKLVSSSNPNCRARFGNMYMVCNLDKEVTQYPSWMENIRNIGINDGDGEDLSYPQPYLHT